MIQRKQTLFLFLAFILTVVCLSLPIGEISSRLMGKDAVMYNLWLRDFDGVLNYSPIFLFVVLLLSCPVCLAAIFMYKKRRLQARLCSVCILLNLSWYVYYIICVLSVFQGYGKFRPAFGAVLPLIALILYIMSRKAILADEALVRAADRIR